MKKRMAQSGTRRAGAARRVAALSTCGGCFTSSTAASARAALSVPGCASESRRGLVHFVRRAPTDQAVVNMLWMPYNRSCGRR